MAKEIFLTNYIPEGQRHCVIDEATYKKKRPGYILFAEKCFTPIKDEDANALLRQNPKLISIEPMSAAAISKEKKRQTRPAYPPDHINRRIMKSDMEIDEATTMEVDRDAGVEPQFVIDDEVKGSLVELAKMSDAEFKELKPVEIAGHGSVLGIKIKTVGVKKTVMLKQLNERAAEIHAELKGADQDYDAEE